MARDAVFRLFGVFCRGCTVYERYALKTESNGIDCNMLYNLPQLISHIIIICCGVALGYIIGLARGRQKLRKMTLEDNFPLLKTPEIFN
jgi:hypothetical protein